MGNGISIGNNIYVNNDSLSEMPDFDHGEVKDVLRVCLFRDNGKVPNGHLKSSIREFARMVYNTRQNTVFSWTTWGSKEADISQTEDTPVRHVFDLIVCVQCTYTFVKNQHLEQMCRMLKPSGLALSWQKRRDRLPGDAAVSKQVKIRENLQGASFNGCESGERLTPVYNHTDESIEYIVFRKDAA